jgi:hypothetical protein
MSVQLSEYIERIGAEVLQRIDLKVGELQVL